MAPTILSRLLPVATLLLVGNGVASATTIYADKSLGADCATAYQPSTRACSGGTAAAYRTLASALNAAQPGDIVDVRSGSFSERLVPPRSGTAAAPITVRAHSGETVTLTGASDPQIFLQGRSYIVVEGLTIDNALGWARIETSHYNRFTGNHFKRATADGTTGGFKFVQSNYNRVMNNTFEDGNDDLVIQQSDHNVIEGNNFVAGRHSIFSLRCGNYNVIRGNYFYNETQKIGEIYDCEGTSDAPVLLDATKHNLVEGNRFAYTLASGQDYRYNGIQYSGQYGIVRRNDFYDNQGGALNFQVYSDEALYNYGHRVYNNTFVSNKCEAIAASGSSTSARYTNNLVVNNLLYKNVGCGGENTQTGVANTTAVVLQNNAIVTTAPPFVDEAARNLALAAGSSLIDKGVFITKTAAAGSGQVLKVTDALWFYDGFGIAGEVGDEIQLQGQTERFRIVSANYSTNELTLDRSATWTAGLGVHLAYAGSAPEAGAHEYGESTVRPSPPTNVQITTP